MMDYPCGKFGDCSFSRFGFIVRIDTLTDAGERFTLATFIGVSNNNNNNIIYNSTFIIYYKPTRSPQQLYDLPELWNVIIMNVCYMFSICEI